MLPLLQLPRFMALTGGINAGVDAAPGCVGKALAISPSLTRFRAETLTVWRSRADAAAFYRSDAHARAMREPMAAESANTFFVRRVMVPAEDVPAAGESSIAFWSAVKAGRYAEA